MARRKTNSGENPDEPSFENALAGLEAIVEAMENEQLPLEELVSYYEKGSNLLSRCETVLQAARGRIELITVRNRNEDRNLAEPGAKTDTNTLSGAPDASDDEYNDDIRLF